MKAAKVNISLIQSEARCPISYLTMMSTQKCVGPQSPLARNKKAGLIESLQRCLFQSYVHIESRRETAVTGCTLRNIPLFLFNLSTVDQCGATRDFANFAFVLLCIHVYVQGKCTQTSPVDVLKRTPPCSVRQSLASAVAPDHWPCYCSG